MGGSGEISSEDFFTCRIGEQFEAVEDGNFHKIPIDDKGKFGTSKNHRLTPFFPQFSDNILQDFFFPLPRFSRDDTLDARDYLQAIFCRWKYHFDTRFS